MEERKKINDSELERVAGGEDSESKYHAGMYLYDSTGDQRLLIKEVLPNGSCVCSREVYSITTPTGGVPILPLPMKPPEYSWKYMFDTTVTKEEIETKWNGVPVH